MFDPTAPTRCVCGNPDCTTRNLDGQRIRALTDPLTGIPFLHRDDVIECLMAAISHVLALEHHVNTVLDLNPARATLGQSAARVPAPLSVFRFMAFLLSDPDRLVPPGHPFLSATAASTAEFVQLLTELDANHYQLDEALRRILDES